MIDTPERRVKSFLEYWPLITVVIGGIVTAITFWNNVNGLVSDQRSFKATVEDRRTKSHDDMEAIRTRLTKLEQWKEDQHGQH